MHFHLEIIMPPTDDVPAAVESILKPFSEDSDVRGEDGRGEPFWDWWQLGGRYSGSKYRSSLDPAKMQQFNDWMNEQKLTISGLVFGKDELIPASQIPVVDAKWNNLFTPAGQPPIACPMFKHSGDQMPMDICTLKDAPRHMELYRCIIAIPGYADGKWKLGNPPEADFMLAVSEWNGCNHYDVKFDGTLQDCLAQFEEKRLKRASGQFLQAATPTDEWLVVTVDYHS